MQQVPHLCSYSLPTTCSPSEGLALLVSGHLSPRGLPAPDTWPEVLRLSSSVAGGQREGGCTGRDGAVQLRYLPINPNPGNSNSAVFYLSQVRE